MESFTIGGVDCSVESPSGKAILVRVFGEEEWIPKSQISDDSEVYKKGTSGDLIVSEWFAKKLGWI